jgi:hypothetical protein
LALEQDRFAEIVGHLPHRSRQHYLYLQFPHTYRNLIKLGLREDYTMGYAAATGFRAGIARPFWWYDLEAEQETDLRVFPFAYMDVSLKQHLKMSPEAARRHCFELSERVRQVGGTLISIWHNSSFAVFESWSGWERAYRQILEQVPKK